MDEECNRELSGHLSVAIHIRSRHRETPPARVSRESVFVDQDRQSKREQGRKTPSKVLPVLWCITPGENYMRIGDWSLSVVHQRKYTGISRKAVYLATRPAGHRIRILRSGLELMISENGILVYLAGFQGLTSLLKAMPRESQP